MVPEVADALERAELGRDTPATNGVLRRLSLARRRGDDLPPHVTLLFPFVDDSQLSARTIDEACRVIGRFRVFDFALNVVGRFDNLPDQSYLWLAPKPAEPFVELTRAVAEAFPDNPPYGGAFAEIVPHVTIVSSTDELILRRAEERISEELPIASRATSVSIMEQRRGSWQLLVNVPLAPV